MPCRLLWSPAGKGLTSWFLFVVYNCEFVTFPLVSWVRYGTPFSPRARNRSIPDLCNLTYFNQVVKAKRFEGVFLCRKVS